MTRCSATLLLLLSACHNYDPLTLPEPEFGDGYLAIVDGDQASLLRAQASDELSMEGTPSGKAVASALNQGALLIVIEEIFEIAGTSTIVLRTAAVHSCEEEGSECDTINLCDCLGGLPGSLCIPSHTRCAAPSGSAKFRLVGDRFEPWSDSENVAWFETGARD